MWQKHTATGRARHPRRNDGADHHSGMQSSSYAAAVMEGMIRIVPSRRTKSDSSDRSDSSETKNRSFMGTLTVFGIRSIRSLTEQDVPIKLSATEENAKSKTTLPRESVIESVTI